MWVNYDDVVNQLRDHGLDITLPLQVATGKKSVRCKVAGGDKERRGWYRLHEWVNGDGELMLVGSFGIFRGSDSGAVVVELSKRCDACGAENPLKGKECRACGAKKFKKRGMSDEEKAAMKARLAAEKKRLEAEEQRRYEECARRADYAWRSKCAEGSRDQSEYLKRKQIEPLGGRFLPGGKFVVPVQDAERRTYGLQVVYDQAKNGRDKSFWPAGMEKKGRFFLIGGIPDQLLLVAEGFATAASLHLATGLPVAVAFDAGNLLPVVLALREKHKRARILICADDDYLQKCRECRGLVLVAEATCPHCGQAHGKDNPGQTHARNAAIAVEGEVVAPEFKDERPVDRKGDTDFNDLHLREGLDAVARQVAARLSVLGWSASSPRRGNAEQPGGGEKVKRRQAQAVMDLDDIVERFVPLDDGTGDYVFDLWTNKVAKRNQMISLLPAGVRGDDIKRHPLWITRGAYYLDQVGFDPSGKDDGVKLNTWQGWPMKPAAGECGQLRELIAYLCGKEENGSVVYEWLLDWMAYPLQNPGAKMSSAVIMHGPQGTGKSTVFQTLAKIYGDYSTVLNQRGLEDKFNSDWSDSKLFILAEEVVTRAEMWHIKNELKELVTGEWIRINPKNVAAYRQRNQVNIAYLSNENQPLPLDNDDRRHLVIYTPPALSESFYDEINRELDNGGIAAFYDFLMRRDLSAFHPKKRPPMTEAKKKLIALSQASELRFINDWITGDAGLPVCPCLSTDLYAAYLRWCRLNGESRPRPSNQFWGAIEHQQGWEKKKARYYPSEMATSTENRAVVIPPMHVLQASETACPEGKKEPVWLGECIRRFGDAMGGESRAAA